MKYATTATEDRRETVLLTLDPVVVPLWDPENPLPGTYLVPDDVEAGWVRDLRTGAFSPPPPPTADQIRQGLESFVQERLDAFARERGYNDLAAVCTYAASGVPAYRSDALVCIDARDQTWQALYALLSEEPPLAPEEILTGLPELKWPPDGAAAKPKKTRRSNG